MGVQFVSSADDHGVSHDDVMWAVTHATAITRVPGRDGHRDATVFVGHPHPQTDRYIEVIAEIVPPRTVVVFHAMELSDKFRWLVQDGG